MTIRDDVELDQPADTLAAGSVSFEAMDRAAQEEVAARLVAEAQAGGLSLVGPDGVLAQLTKRVLELGLEVEMSEHVGYDKHSAEGRNGGNSRNGTRSKTVLTDIGPVTIDVPRDRDGTFEPRTIRKRQRRLDGVDAMVLSLSAKGLTTGEISAHLAEVYGAEVSRDTISAITDAIVEEMTGWLNRPLDRIYPVVFIADRPAPSTSRSETARSPTGPSTAPSASPWTA